MHKVLFIILILVDLTVRAQQVTIGHVTRQPYPPYAWWDESQQAYKGYNRAVMESVFKSLDLEIVDKTLTQSKIYNIQPILDSLDNGTIDMYIFAGQVSTRLKSATSISTPVSQIMVRPFVLREKYFEFNEWSDLKGLAGLHIDVQGNFIAGDQNFDEYARRELNIKPAPSLNDMISAIEKGEADYFITEYRSALMGIRSTGDPKRIVALDKSIVSIPLIWAISNKSFLLSRKGEIDQLLEQYETDGRLQLIMQQSMQEYMSVLNK